MSITVYQQSKAFVRLSRFKLTRLLVSTGICTASYLTGQQLCHQEGRRSRQFGQILKHYALFCSTIHWGHVGFMCGTAMWYARTKNLPRAVYLYKGLSYGERMGFGAMIVYGVCRELTSREWFAMTAGGSYSGLVASIILRQRGWLAGRTIRNGAMVGVAFFIAYSAALYCQDLWRIFVRPDLKYSQWDEFNTVEYAKYRMDQFFNYSAFMNHIFNTEVQQSIIAARDEMNELERLAAIAGIDPSEYVHVDPKEVSEVMFDVMDRVKTGRPQFDDLRPTTTTMAEMQYRQVELKYDVRPPETERHSLIRPPRRAPASSILSDESVTGE